MLRKLFFLALSLFSSRSSATRNDNKDDRRSIKARLIELLSAKTASRPAARSGADASRDTFEINPQSAARSGNGSRAPTDEQTASTLWRAEIHDVEPPAHSHDRPGPEDSVLKHLNSKHALRDAWIVREILDKPLALRGRGSPHRFR